MGVLTDLVIAYEADSNRLANSRYPLGEFSGIDIKGIDSVMLTTLHGILSGKPYDELPDLFNPVAEVSEDGPWVYVLPADLVERLSNIDEFELMEVAGKWARTEEFRYDKWSEEEVASLLSEIVDLARQAALQSKRLFTWVCL